MRTNTPVVSVLMTVFNGEKYIYESINSIIEQTYKNWELLIVNDKSTDSTLKIIKQFKDKRINLINLKKKAGRTKALNLGLNKCRGEYVAIQDSDDLSAKTRLEKQFYLLSKDKKLALVFSWYKRIDKLGNVKKMYNDNLTDYEIKKFLPVKNLICHSSVMYKKLLILKIGGYPKDFIFSQEYILWLKILIKYKVKLIKFFLVKYRDHDDQLTNSKSQQIYIFKENLKILSWSRKNLLINKYNIFYYLKNLLINYFRLIKNLFYNKYLIY
jgi:glycosyltransferase involved in cell wall biosynthesis